MVREITVERPLILASDIEQRVREIAAAINRDFRDENPLSVIVVLKGAVFFAIDLLRHITLPTRVDFLQASSYSGTGSTGEVRLHKDIAMPIANTPVLLIEDIVDSGLTASWLKQHLASHHPASIHLVTLLDKPAGRKLPVDIDYTGFVIPDEFVLGYGLDYDEGYRNLPAIYVAREMEEGETGRSL